MAKLTDDQLRFIIDLDAKGAQGKINTLEESIRSLEKENGNLQRTVSANEKEMASLEKQMERLRRKGEENTTAYRTLQKQYDGAKQSAAQFKQELEQNSKKIDQSRRAAQNLTNGLKTNEMTMRQLRERARQLQQQLDVTSKSASPETYEKLSRELENTQKAMGRLSEKSKTLKSATSTFLGNIASAAYIKGLQLLTTAIRSGIQTIIDFEQENANLASVLIKSQEDIKALTDDAKRLGAQTRYTASQITQLQTELAKLGFSETQILKSTEAVQAFATATGASLPDAAKAGAAALRAFGLDASEMERVVSTMGVATSKSALDFTYLQNSMSTVAPVAKKFGFSIEDTTALLGTLANSGFEASTAATATKNILLKLADSSSKLSKKLGEPIKNMDDLVPALRKLKDGGIDLAEAFELTDQRSVAAFATFLDNTDTLRDLRDSITDVSDELHKMEKERLKTVSGSLDLLSSAWNGLMLSFSNSKGPIKVAVDWLTGFVDTLKEGVEAIDRLATTQETEAQRMERISLEAFKKEDLDTQLSLIDNYSAQLQKRTSVLQQRYDKIMRDPFVWNKPKKLAELAQAISETNAMYEQGLQSRRDIIAQQEEDEKKRLEREAEARKQAETDAAREAEKQRLKAAEEAQKQKGERFKKELAALKENLEQQLLEESRNYLKRGYSKEQYEQNVKDLTSKNLEEQLTLARKYGIDVTKIEQQVLNDRIKQRENAEEDRLKADAEILKSAQKARDEMLRVYTETEKAALDALESEWKAGHLGTADYEQKRKELTEQYAALRLQTEKTFATAVKGLNESIVDGAAQAVEKAEQALTDAQGRNISRLKGDMHDLAGIVEQTASLMGDTLGGQVMQGLEKSMSAVSDFMEQSSHTAADYVNMIGSVMQGMMQGVEQMMKTTFEAETAALEAEKAKQLSLVGDNSEAREKIEYEYAQKALDLKKKQADSEAAMQTANLWINTAVGIAGAWSSSIAQLGPIAGSIAAAAISALLLTTAGIQQNNILKQRDAIKNTTLESSAGSSGISSASSTDVTAQLKKEFTTAGIADQLPEGFASGGYTGDGGVLQPAGIVHKGEYVVAQAEMHNPKVVPMVRAIEQVRQKRINGSVADPAQHAYATGGLAGDDNSELVAIVKQLSEQLLEIKRTPLRASVNYQEFEHADNLMTALRQRVSNN